MSLSSLRKTGAVVKREIMYHFPRPRTATLALTQRCNLKCRACGVWRQPARKSDELGLEVLCRVLGELKGLGAQKVLLIEGEPLLRTDIVPLVHEITRLGMASEMTTNGVLLTAAKARQLAEAGLGCVTCSIDAPNQTHDTLRGVRGVFDRVVVGVRNVNAARHELASASPRVFVNSLLTSESIPFLSGWLDFAKDLGVDGLNFIYPTFVPDEVDAAAQIDGTRASSGRFAGFDRSLIISRDLIPNVLDQLKRIRAEGARRGIAVWLSPDMYLSTPEEFETGRSPTRRCSLIRDSIIVDPYGEVIPCALLDKYSYGSVLDQPLSRIWLNDRHRALIRAVDGGLDICRYCRCHFGHNITLWQQVQRKLKSV